MTTELELSKLFYTRIATLLEKFSYVRSLQSYKYPNSVESFPRL